MFPLPIGDCHFTPGHLHFPCVALRTAAQFFLPPVRFVEFHPTEGEAGTPTVAAAWPGGGQPARTEQTATGVNVSDLRQSRRLVGGGAAQRRMALRAVIVLAQSVQPLKFSCVYWPSALVARKARQHQYPCRTPATGFYIRHTRILVSPSRNTPGAVKLWEPPRQSRGVSPSSRLPCREKIEARSHARTATSTPARQPRPDLNPTQFHFSFQISPSPSELPRAFHGPGRKTPLRGDRCAGHPRTERGAPE